MSQVNEVRARPVTRYVLTHYTAPDHKDAKGGKSRMIGEFPTSVAADEMGEAIAASLGAVYNDCPKDMADVPRFLRTIADQIDNGVVKANVGVLSLRMKGSGHPIVYGFGHEIDPYQEFLVARDHLMDMYPADKANFVTNDMVRGASRVTLKTK